jgi:hypothetical protein
MKRFLLSFLCGLAACGLGGTPFVQVTITVPPGVVTPDPEVLEFTVQTQENGSTKEDIVQVNVLDLTFPMAVNLTFQNQANRQPVHVVVKGFVSNNPTEIDLQTPPGATISLIGVDFDQDNQGNLDLVALLFSSGQLQVKLLLGNGIGIFSPPVTFSVGAAAISPVPGPHQLVSGDLNGDGLLDLVVLHAAQQQLQIFTGDATLGFLVPQSLTLGTTPTSVSLADLSGDGVSELIVTSSTQLLILPGLSGAQFGTALIVEAGISPVSVASGDLNGDSLLDLVVAEKGAAALRVFFANP